MVQVTITLSDAIFIRNVDGEAVKLDNTKMTAAIVARVYEAGAKVILTNAYNGGGKTASEAEKASQMNKRMDAWYKGEYAVTERGASQETLMKEVYVTRVVAAKGCSIADVEKAIKATVQKVMGKDTAAKFGTFLTCVAKQKFAGDDAAAAAWEAETIAELESEAAKLAAERSKASEAIDLSDFDF